MDTDNRFIQQLTELRIRMIRAGVVLIIVFLILFRFSSDIYHLLALPMLKNLPLGGQMIATEVSSPFTVPLKLTLLCAFLLSLPHTFYQVWGFVAPGLYQHEKSRVMPLIMASSVLFLMGMVFAYFLVLPLVFHFFTGVAPLGVAVMTDINRYLEFVLNVLIVFGITFEVPIIVLMLVKLGIVDVLTLKNSRRYMIVAAFVFSAIVTPPDVLSQIMLSIPLCLLYELGILAAQCLSIKR